MPWFLLWDIVRGAFLLGLAALFFVVMIVLAFIGLLNALDWWISRREYNGLKRSLLRAAQKKPDDTGGVHAAIPK